MKDKHDEDLSLEINFTEIGNSIKRSVNNVIKMFTEEKPEENLPQIKNKAICAQEPPELTKAKTMRVFSFISVFVLGLITLGMWGDFFYNRGFVGFFLSFIFLVLTISVPATLYLTSREIFKLSNNFTRFKKELGNNTVISIKDLASSVAQTEAETVDDLMKMMKRGYFYQARIVEDDSLFLLDIPTFKLYKEKRGEISSSYRVPEVESQKEEVYEISAEDLSVERAREIILASREEIELIKAYKGKISNQYFRNHVDEILNNSEVILQILGKYPQKSVALNKFADYYLPTTAKLVETYWEFEAMRTDDRKIIKSMEEINSSIATIDEAFEKIKVELLSDRAMDIKTDIDTINLLLNQEGYTGDDWSY